jgi:hypothetical protein
MNINTLISKSMLSKSVVLSLVLGASGVLYAQEQRDEPKPSQEETRPQAAKPDEDKAKARQQDEAKPEKENQDKDKATKAEDKSSKQDAAKAEHGQMQASGGHGGARIPDDKFRAHFGRQHTFAIRQPNIVNGRPQFQYGGYSFTIVDAWPVGWAYTDNCYIDYIDGEYFLFDLLHPGVQLALVVVL